jgi:hypothetical protein
MLWQSSTNGKSDGAVQVGYGDGVGAGVGPVEVAAGYRHPGRALAGDQGGRAGAARRLAAAPRMPDR